MDVEISTSDPDHVDPARVAAALQAANLFVLTVTVNEDIDGAWVYDPAADVIDEADRHPEHTECFDGCGLAVTHVGACLDRPGGRVVCHHEDDEQAEPYANDLPVDGGYR